MLFWIILSLALIQLPFTLFTVLMLLAAGADKSEPHPRNFYGEL